MSFSQFIEDSSMSFHSPITKEEWDRITDVELERTETIVFKTPSGKEVPFRKVKHGEWIDCDAMSENFEFCSICKWENDVGARHYNFCPNCGADMRGETE